MDIKPLTDAYAVSPQIAPEEIEAIAAAGYTTVICNRPDEEVPGDFQAEAVRAAAEAAGLAFVINPVRPGQFTPEVLETQGAALDAATGPVLAYCASGNRCALVWSLLKAPELGADGVLARTRAAGYDHAQFRPQFEAMTRD